MEENKELSQQEITIEDTADKTTSSYVMNQIIAFLMLMLSETLARRIVCIIVLSLGLPDEMAITYAGVSARTVRSVRANLKKGLVVTLLSVRGGGRISKLDDESVAQTILNQLEKGNYHTRQQIADMVLETCGIKVSLTAVGRFLKNHSYKLRKCGSLPAKADPKKQREFVDETLNRLVEESREGQVALYFMDASHFVLGNDFLGRVYSIKRRFVKTFSGRQRYNILGALNFLTKEMLTVTNTTYITATEVCELFRKIAAASSGVPIHIILDNARYQKCDLVAKVAAELNITLDYLPPYSPNLNLIERYWKYVKGKLRTKYYSDFNIFSETIDSIIRSAPVTDKKAIDTLIGGKVQLFDNLVQINDTTYSLDTKRSDDKTQAA